MHTFTRIASSLLLCAAVGACSGGGPEAGEGGPGGGGGGGSTSNISVDGDYVVKTKLSVDASKIDAEFIDFEDLAKDPIGALTDMVSDEIGIPGFASILVEQFIEDFMGDKADTLAEAAQDMLDATVAFDVVTEMGIKKDGDAYSMTHHPVGMEVTIDDQSYEYSFEDNKFDSVDAYKLTATKRGDITFTEHPLEIPYAQMVLTVIDQLVVPKLDPRAENLGDGLKSLVDCVAFGKAGEAKGIEFTLFGVTIKPDAGDYASACRNVLDAVAISIYHEANSLDSLKLSVTLSGKASASDSNNDGKADTIKGKWVDLGSEQVSLPDANFEAQRMR